MQKGSIAIMSQTQELTHKGYLPTIGIEVHAELKTETKMFCNSKNSPHEAGPNVHVCPVCMAHPGTLPVINVRAVEHVVRVGMALGGEIATFTEFDRKNYFYPDIPKGYQISQYLYPIVKGGTLAGVEITRVHLEEDTARSLHDQGEGSIVDYNRAGVPLMELVTEPVIHDAATAAQFARELQLLLRTLGVSEANMEKGEMRVEANISVSKTDTFGTKVEVKNLNSFKAVENAILYEIRRQSELLDSGGSVIQETRGWDENKSKTFSQRKKESANDYRYFPDPDLPKLDLSKVASLSRIRETMPELPDIKRGKYRNLGLSREQIEMIIGRGILVGYFESILSEINSEADEALLAANYLTSDIAPLLQSGHELTTSSVATFVKLIRLLRKGTINSRVAKDILVEVVFNNMDPEVIVRERGLSQNSSEDAIRMIVKQVIEENTSVVADYKSGKVAVVQFLIGQGMRLSKGSANPEILKGIFLEELQ
jgi:aspartyl-tRNA(Asn)/glutamyl-tRNA(Gln) amidotransferase subunit B